MSAISLLTSGFPLGAPDADRPPMKVNAFETMRCINHKLCPMFPAYLDKGCIVPCMAIFTGGPGRSFSMFKHENCVDEVFTILSANGLPMAPGTVMMGGKTHFVNVPMKDPTDPSNFVLFVITQRQWEAEEPQHETVTLVCQQCQEPLLAHSYLCDPSDAEMQALAQRRDFMPFATTIESARVADMLNADPSLLVCKECGFENKAFATEDWGWKNYVEATRTVTAALSSYPVAQKA